MVAAKLAALAITGPPLHSSAAPHSVSSDGTSGTPGSAGHDTAAATKTTVTKTALVAGVLQFADIEDPEFRRQVLQLMGDFLGLGRPFAVPYRTMARDHVVAIVDQCWAFKDPDAARRALVGALSELRPDDGATGRLIRAVEQVAASRPALAPLAAQLNADALLAEVRGLRQDYGRRTSTGVKPERRARESQTQIFAVVDALLTLEAIADEGARREVLRLLPAEISGAIPHHAVPRVQVLAIVRTCLSYEGGLRELLEAVRVVERDSVGMRELDDTMNNAFPGYLTG